MKVDFYKHNIDTKDIENLTTVLNSLFLSTWDVVAEFEDKLSKFNWNKYSIWLKSWTAALFLSLKYFNIWEWDEVITTPLSFISTANSIEHTWATPVFVDVEKETWNIDIDKIEEKITNKTKAIIPVHLYGQMVDMKRLRKLADKYNLKIIEDSAHCLEWKRDWIKPWNLWDCTCFSFYTVKNITSWEWWAISTNNKDMHDWLKKARLHWMSKTAIDRYNKKYEHYDMEFLWYKENMTNIDASLLVNQIDRVNVFLKSKEFIANKYNEWFKDNKKIYIPEVIIDSKHARHLYTIVVDGGFRDKYIEELQNKWIWIAVNFRAIHLMKYYKDKYWYKAWDFPVAEYYWNGTISIPMYPKLKDDELGYIIKTINNIKLW
jgi:dTDP-4-amino-4,6-dideoxygalactose transaminase